MLKILSILTILFIGINLYITNANKEITNSLFLTNIEALSFNESDSGDGYTVCIVGDRTIDSSVEPRTWCGNCRSVRVVQKGDEKCKIG